jgi:hypothetical protein
MNAEKIAKAIKSYLVDLAINDKLPTDLNELSIANIVNQINQTAMNTEKTFKFKKQGNNYVAFDAIDKTISYGRINIKTGECVGGTLCFTALREYLASKKVVAKVTYKLWVNIEKHVEYTDGTDTYEDLKNEETRSVGEYNSLEDAYEQMNLLSDMHQGDNTNQ